MKRKAVGSGLYVDKLGEYWTRPNRYGKRTWLKLGTNNLERANRLMRRPWEDKRAYVEDLQAEIDSLKPTMDHMPEVLYAHGHKVKVFNPPPAECGIYFLMDGPKCVYVGQATQNVHIRLSRHRVDKIFDKAFFLPVRNGNISSLEEDFIQKLKPKYNRKLVFDSMLDKNQRHKIREELKAKIIERRMAEGGTKEEAEARAKEILESRFLDIRLMLEKMKENWDSTASTTQNISQAQILPQITNTQSDASVAQLDRASDFGSDTG